MHYFEEKKHANPRGQWKEALSDAWRRGRKRRPKGINNALKHSRYTKETIEERKKR